MADKTQTNQSSSTVPQEQQQKHYSPWRRGSQMASERDYHGVMSRTSTGFSNSAAKFDDTWGNNAFTETGFTEIGFADTTDDSGSYMSSTTATTTTTKDTKSTTP